MCNKPLPVILVVEDEPAIHRWLCKEFSGQAIILSALTIEEGERLFQENPDLSAVAMDACVPGNKPTTLPLARKIRQTFKGPMIAISSLDEYRHDLMSAGCNYECPKGQTAQRIRQVLGLVGDNQSLKLCQFS